MPNVILAINDCCSLLIPHPLMQCMEAGVLGAALGVHAVPAVGVAPGAGGEPVPPHLPVEGGTTARGRTLKLTMPATVTSAAVSICGGT